ncbi:ADP-ribosylglycohydrolase family protein [Streptosporangium sp. NPDC051022]|uniref:ADP-ribosylglycohydrolase family protein n=1 Tax=Streptosporangium sp. NPDC051022 TaxID=3155752 RepID=UPI0034277EB4
MSPTSPTSPARAAASLRGLSLGDALGARLSVRPYDHFLAGRTPPPGTWRWTDDTEMACSVHRVLAGHGSIDQSALAASFAEHHDPDRGYGAATERMLHLVRCGADWEPLAASAFGGRGSWGNGAAMRVAPLGAWFAGDPERAVRQAALSARVTHTHPEAVAGAAAVAAAAAIAACPVQAASDLPPDRRSDRLLGQVLEHLPAGLVRDGVAEARRLLTVDDPGVAASVLGKGGEAGAHDTVPFSLWAAAKHLDDFEQAFWTSVQPDGDTDTICAIVCGIVAARVGPGRLPRAWTESCEPLPSWALL